MLPAQYRMTRSADFTHTVRCGVRSAQPDIVVHARRVNGDGNTPLIGLIVAKSVGGAVQRHRVARKLRHAARSVLGELNPADRVVIRALPGSFGADSARLTAELRTGVRRALEVLEQRR